MSLAVLKQLIGTSILAQLQARTISETRVMNILRFWKSQEVVFSENLDEFSSVEMPDWYEYSSAVTGP